MAEEGWIDIGPEGVDVVEHEGFQAGALGEKTGEGAVEEEIGQLIEMPDGMQALEREVAGVIARLPRPARPADEGGAEGIAHFLLLLVERLLRHFLPRETQVALGGDHAQADGAAGGKMERAGVAVVAVVLQELAGRPVG